MIHIEWQFTEPFGGPAQVQREGVGEAGRAGIGEEQAELKRRWDPEWGLGNGM